MKSTFDGEDKLPHEVSLTTDLTCTQESASRKLNGCNLVEAGTGAGPRPPATKGSPISHPEVRFTGNNNPSSLKSTVRTYSFVVSEPCMGSNRIIVIPSVGVGALKSLSRPCLSKRSSSPSLSI